MKSVIRALGSTEFYEYFMDAISTAENQIQFSNRRMEKLIDESWIDAIEEALPGVSLYIDVSDGSTEKLLPLDDFTSSSK